MPAYERDLESGVACTDPGGLYGAHVYVRGYFKRIEIKRVHFVPEVSPRDTLRGRVMLARQAIDSLTVKETERLMAISVHRLCYAAQGTDMGKPIHEADRLERVFAMAVHPDPTDVLEISGAPYELSPDGELGSIHSNIPGAIALRPTVFLPHTSDEMGHVEQVLRFGRDKTGAAYLALQPFVKIVDPAKLVAAQ